MSTIYEQAQGEHRSADPDSSLVSSPKESFESDGQGPSAGKDLFSSLAPELLSQIIAFSNCTVAISRYLLPFTQIQLYRSVNIKSWPQLNLFIRTILNDGRGGITNQQPPEELVTELKLAADHFCISPEDDPDRAQIPEETTIVSLYSRLKYLSVLDIVDRGPCALAIFSPSLKGALLELRRLEFCWAAPPNFDASHFKYLNQYPMLSCIHMSLETNFAQTLLGEEQALSTPLPVEWSKNISHISIRIQDEQIIKLIRDFIAFFPSLKALDVALPSFMSFSPGTTLAQAPSGLKRIKILLLHHQDDIPAELNDHIDLVIGRFTYLEELFLGPRQYTPAIFLLLPKLPIAHLTFIVNDLSELPFSSLAGVLKGPHKITTLEALVLTTWQNSFYPCRATIDGQDYEELVPPVWTLDFTYKEAEALLNLSVEAEVELYANIMHGIMEERKIRKSLRKVEDEELQTGEDLRRMKKEEEIQSQ